MGESYLKQILTYTNKVYDIGEKINTLKDKRLNPQINTATVSFVVLFGFMLQIRSFNRLEHWVKKNRFKKLLPKGTRIPHIDAIRRTLSQVDLSNVRDMHDHIIKTVVKNKIFRNGTIDGLKVVAVDGVELFDSTNKCCNNCLTRIDNQKVTHYFHRAVVCATVGSDPHIILGHEALEPKKDDSDKDEGEITGGKRLIKKLHHKFHHFADIVVADALYCKASWIKEILSIDMDAVVRVKDERLHIVKDALGLFKSRGCDKEWVIKTGNQNKTIVKAWDEDGFEMNGLDIKVRFMKFLEEIHTGDKVEIKEAWIITTSKVLPIETIWKIMHKRWDIENNAFHQLKTGWHLGHCFLHDSTGIEAVLMLIIIAFNLMQLYFFRCIRGFRKKRLLQIDIIEDLKDEMLLINNWNNPLFISS